MKKLIEKLKWKFCFKLFAEILIALTIFMALSYWQESDMLESDVKAPVLSAMALDGKIYEFPSTANSSRRTLIYFFAPWCNVCHLSIGNLNILRSQLDEESLSIIIVALDWQSKAEIEDYMLSHELNFPVLLGDEKWTQQYKIKGFPSYYVLNQQAEILSRSMGYSTTAGMLGRILMN